MKRSWQRLLVAGLLLSVLSLGTVNSVSSAVDQPEGHVQLRTTAPSGDLSTTFPFCSWWVQTSTTSTNMAFPDINAAYWTMPFSLDGGDIRITGDYINARYFSVQVYNQQGQLSDGSTSLADYLIEPSNGFSNPWSTGIYPAETPQAFQITVSSSSNGVEGSNVLSMPDTGTIGLIMLRVYVPDSLPFPENIFGASNTPAQTIPDAFALISGHLPLVTVASTSGDVDLPTCSSTQGAQLTNRSTRESVDSSLDLLVPGIAGAKSHAAAGPRRQGSTTPRFKFFRTASSTTPFPNGNSAYAAAVYKVFPGEAVIVRAELPSTPWNSPGTTWQGSNPVPWPTNGDSSNYQLRYLSFCSYLDKPPYPVVSVQDGCATDTQIRTAMNGDSAAIAIVTRPSERPTVQEVGSDFIWLPAAISKADQVFAIRNMLPSTSFKESVTNVTPPEEGSVDPTLTKSVMGQYYPTAYRCDLDVLKKVGPINCRKKLGSVSRSFTVRN